MADKLHISQSFYSIQGEGPRTGRLAVWLRMFGCPLRCPGFSQPNPKDPSTYIKPISFDPKSIKTLDDFPVIEHGCDTLYAIDPKFKHLRRTMSIEDAYKEVVDYLPKGGYRTDEKSMKWYHPVTQNEIDLAITGGEPMLQQEGIAALLQMVSDNAGIQPAVQFETNLVKPLESTLSKVLLGNLYGAFFNVSPKLYAVSGEDYQWSAANLSSMEYVGDVALKIVVNETDDAWKELDTKVDRLSKDLGGRLPPIYVMPVGSTREQQTNEKVLEQITRRAIDNGYHVSGRLHCVLLGNDISA